MPARPLRAPLQRHELTLNIAALICDIIRLDGIADHSAGALVGVNRATLEWWRAEDEAFALALEEARAQFEWDLVRKIKDARRRDGTPDTRAHMWLLKNASAAGFTKPARAAKPATAPVQKGANLPETPASPPATAAHENTANLPETPARPDQRRQAATPLAGRITPAGMKIAA